MSNHHPSPLTEQDARDARELLERALYELKKIIVGQEYLLERLLVAVIAHGHVLVEGAPGLAKTLTLKTLARVMAVDFKRIQFTPDLLPSDLIGTRVYNPANGNFTTELGPLFANFILADEINRAPAKVQSALLEAMQEQQVTIGRETFLLQSPFLVMATQNPIEAEGTYPLPEAQLDRFLFKLLVDYPDTRDEVVIIQRMTAETLPALESMLDAARLMQLSEQAMHVYLDPQIMAYIADIIQATRTPHPAATLKDQPLKSLIQYGASPRGSLALAQASKALALLRGRNYVVPEDVTLLINDCLRHRILLSYEALAQGLTTDDILTKIKQGIVPPGTSPALAGFASHPSQDSDS